MAGRPQRTLIPGFPCNSSLDVDDREPWINAASQKMSWDKTGPLSPGSCIEVKKSLKGAWTERET